MTRIHVIRRAINSQREKDIQPQRIWSNSRCSFSARAGLS